MVTTLTVHDVSVEPQVAASDDLPYFLRPGLVDVVMKIMRIGLKQGVVLYAPRGKGKTSFLLREVLPTCELCGLAVSYIELRNCGSDPGLALVAGVEGITVKWAPTDRRPIELVDRPGTAATDLSARLRQAVQRLAARSGHSVLILDGFDALAVARAESLVAALRTVLQDERGRVFVVYAGSSAGALNELFRRRHAPLFESAMFLELPDLERDFIEDRARVFTERTGLPVDPDELNKGFEHAGRCPGPLNSIVLDMVRRRSTNVQTSLKRWLSGQLAI